MFGFKKIIQRYKSWRIIRQFDEPDVWLAVVNVGDDQVYAQIKDAYALLNRVPKPTTGYHFKDVVKVKGPVGKTSFRDDEIPVYEAQNVIRPGLPTFTFYAVVPNTKDWFDLSEHFNSEELGVEFPYSSKPTDHWQKGYCSAKNIEIARSKFEEFVGSDVHRRVRDIKLANKPAT